MPGNITDVTYSTFSGFTVTEDTFTGDSIHFKVLTNVLQCPMPNCTQGFTVATIDITADHRPVPEPGVLAIFGLGLAGLGVMRRRRGR